MLCKISVFVCVLSGTWQGVVVRCSEERSAHSDVTFKVTCTRTLMSSTETRWYNLEYVDFFLVCWCLFIGLDPAQIRCFLAIIKLLLDWSKELRIILCYFFSPYWLWVSFLDCSLWNKILYNVYKPSFCALMLLVGWQKRHMAFQTTATSFPKVFLCGST